MSLHQKIYKIEEGIIELYQSYQIMSGRA